MRNITYQNKPQIHINKYIVYSYTNEKNIFISFDVYFVFVVVIVYFLFSNVEIINIRFRFKFSISHSI
jgi:hypothetical protein